MTAAAIVGGGPAGLMAAEVLITAGLTVDLYDRMPTVGRKLLVAGRGGLNLTHSEPVDAMIGRYGAAAGRLRPALVRWDNQAARSWAAGLGQPTFVGSSGRVFPDGLRATPLLRAWLARLTASGVRFHPGHRWTGWADDGALAFRRGDVEVRTRPDGTLLALGGASWPRTGSDGAWVDAIVDAGISVAPLRPSNCGFVVGWSSVFRERFEGEPVKDVVLHHGERTARGDLVVTADGLEGGPLYALSADLRDRIDADGHATVHLDALPDTDPTTIANRLRARRRSDSTSSTLRRLGLRPVSAGLLRETCGVDLTGVDLSGALKAMPVRLLAPNPIARSISTAGGVRFDELDEHWMVRRRPGTFVAGEMVDWEAPTGGYLLQGALSSGVAAAEGMLAWLG